MSLSLGKYKFGCDAGEICCWGRIKMWQDGSLPFSPPSPSFLLCLPPSLHLSSSPSRFTTQSQLLKATPLTHWQLRRFSTWKKFYLLLMDLDFSRVLQRVLSSKVLSQHKSSRQERFPSILFQGESLFFGGLNHRYPGQS